MKGSDIDHELVLFFAGNTTQIHIANVAKDHHEDQRNNRPSNFQHRITFKMIALSFVPFALAEDNDRVKHEDDYQREQKGNQKKMLMDETINRQSLLAGFHRQWEAYIEKPIHEKCTDYHQYTGNNKMSSIRR